MKNLLLVTVFTCGSTYLVCSEQVKKNQAEEDSQSFFSLLEDPLKRSDSCTSPFETVKITCKNYPHVVKDTVDPKTGAPALHVLFHGALQRAEESPINSSIDWHFSFPILYELLACGLDPKKHHVWDSQDSALKQTKQSFFDLLEKHQEKPGVPFIIEKTKEFTAILAEKRKAPAANHLWEDIFAEILSK